MLRNLYTMCHWGGKEGVKIKDWKLLEKYLGLHITFHCSVISNFFPQTHPHTPCLDIFPERCKKKESLLGNIEQILFCVKFSFTMGSLSLCFLLHSLLYWVM